MTTSGRASATRARTAAASRTSRASRPPAHADPRPQPRHERAPELAGGAGHQHPHASMRGREREVVRGEAARVVGGDAQRHLRVLDGDVGMVVERLRRLGHAVHERDRRGKGLELVLAAQPVAVALPIRARRPGGARSRPRSGGGERHVRAASAGEPGRRRGAAAAAAARAMRRLFREAPRGRPRQDPRAGVGGQLQAAPVGGQLLPLHPAVDLHPAQRLLEVALARRAGRLTFGEVCSSRRRFCAARMRRSRSTSRRANGMLSGAAPDRPRSSGSAAQRRHLRGHVDARPRASPARRRRGAAAPPPRAAGAGPAAPAACPAAAGSSSSSGVASPALR